MLRSLNEAHEDLIFFIDPLYNAYMLIPAMITLYGLCETKEMRVPLASRQNRIHFTTFSSSSSLLRSPTMGKFNLSCLKRFNRDIATIACETAHDNEFCFVFLRLSGFQLWVEKIENSRVKKRFKFVAVIKDMRHWSSWNVETCMSRSVAFSAFA